MVCAVGNRKPLSFSRHTLNEIESSSIHAGLSELLDEHVSNLHIQEAATKHSDSQAVSPYVPMCPIMVVYTSAKRELAVLVIPPGLVI